MIKLKIPTDTDEPDGILVISIFLPDGAMNPVTCQDNPSFNLICIEP